jgi:hypothetical protein
VFVPGAGRKNPAAFQEPDSDELLPTWQPLWCQQHRLQRKRFRMQRKLWQSQRPGHLPEMYSMQHLRE